MKNILSIIILIAIVIVGFGVYSKETPIMPSNLGAIGQIPNKATTTDATWNNTNNPGRFRVLKTGSGVLSRIVITGGTQAAALNFYDATTTDATLRTNRATTTICAVNVSTPANTYTCEAAFTYGLIVEFPTAIGAASSTILWQ